MQYFGTRLSENISRRDPEGYLICLNVPVARTGVQEYLPSELGLPGPDDRMIPVQRTEEEVFAPACMASFEGMPVTDDHPYSPEGVTAENIRYLQKGHAHNIRRGAPPDADLLLADLIITDPLLTEEILSGKREISCGYNYVLAEKDGRYFQRDIRGNHVAVVDSGRAGPRVSIRDRKRLPAQAARTGSRQPFTDFPGEAAGGKNPERSNFMTRKNQWRAKLMALMARDGDIESLAEMITEMANAAEASAGAPAAPEAGENPMAAAHAAAENEAPAHATGAADPGADPAAAGESTARGTDCGPEILEVLRRIAGLLEANALQDCGPAVCRQDESAEITAAAAETVTETAPAEAAEALAETAARVLGAAGTQAEPDSAAAESAEALAEAAAQALGIPVPAEPGADEDPVEELVAGVLAEIDPPASPAAEAVQAEILSAVLEPDQGSGDADPEEAADPARAADALRTALAAFRPHLERMTPKERLRFNADFSARMRKLLRASDAASGRPSPYAAIRGAAARREDVRDLGRKIMETRNINLRG